MKDAPSDLEAIDKFVSAFGLDFQSMMQQDLAASRPMPLKDRVWHVSKVCLSLAQSTLALHLLHNAALQLKGHTMRQHIAGCAYTSALHRTLHHA